MSIEISPGRSPNHPRAEHPAEIGIPAFPGPGVQPDRVTGLEAELAEMRDRWVRSEAEVANVRVRARRDVDEARQFAMQKFAADVVEAAENLHHGVASLPAPSGREPEIVTRLRDGFSGVERSFVDLLERNGIKRADPVGLAFNPDLHQAIDRQVSSDHPTGTVLRAMTSAWTVNGRLLRPAMVVVAA